jgi:cell division septation protein DedD
MTPDRDSRLAPSDQPDNEFDDDEDTVGRSLFSATWFRVVLVLIAVVIAGSVAVPYVLEVVNPPAPLVGVAANPNLRPTPATTPTAPIAPRTATPPTPSEGVGVRPSTTAQTTTPAAAPTTSVPSAPSAIAPPPATTAPAKPKEVTTAAPVVTKPVPKEVAAAAPAVTKPAPTEAPKPVTPAKDEAASKMAQAAPRTERAAPARAPAVEGGDYFVQVGAFKDQETAKRLAATLRAQDYPVTESVKRIGDGAIADVPRPAPRPRAPAPSASGPADRSDRYDVLVTGGSAADINAKLVAKGLAAEPAGDGVRIRPSLPLRDAVALSKDLNNEGFKVQVRRGGAPSAAASAPAAPVKPPSVTDGDGGGETVYRVRVGGYADRATAVSVLRALQGKGYQPFIAKGRE